MVDRKLLPSSSSSPLSYPPLSSSSFFSYEERVGNCSSNKGKEAKLWIGCFILFVKELVNYKAQIMQNRRRRTAEVKWSKDHFRFRAPSEEHQAFSHPQQGRIDFNTVNPSLPIGMDCQSTETVCSIFIIRIKFEIIDT